MPDILSICLLISFLCFVSGLFSPESVIRFGQLINKTRMNVFRLYGVTTIILFGAFLLHATPDKLSSNTVHSSEYEDVEDRLTEDIINESLQHMIGEISVINDVQIQVINVMPIQADAINKPKDGYEFIEIELVLKNNGSENKSYNQFQFTLTDNSKVVTVPTFNTINNQTALNLGELQPQEVVRGTIIFEVLKETSNKILIYQTTSNATKQSTYFNLEQQLVTFEPLTSNLDSNVIKDDMCIGDIVDLGNVDIQVLTVSPYEIHENFGKEYLQVKLTIKNKGQSPLVYYPFNFKLLNGNFQTITPLLSLTSLENALGMGELVSGGAVTGTIVFEKPTTLSDYYLLYEPASLFTTQSVKINLQESVTIERLLQADSQLLTQQELIKVNETGTVNKIDITVNKVSNELSTIYHEPKNGYKYVVLDLTVTNNHTTPLNYSLFDFKIMNESGQLSAPIIPVLNEDIEIKTGKLEKNQVIEGVIVFEQPLHHEEFYLLYTPSNLLSNETLWFDLNNTTRGQ